MAKHTIIPQVIKEVKKYIIVLIVNFKSMSLIPRNQFFKKG